MTETIATLETIDLLIERRDGWLSRIVGAIDAAGHRLDSFVLRGAATPLLTVTLTLRVAVPQSDTAALLPALERLPGVHRAPLPPIAHTAARGTRMTSRARPIRHLRDLAGAR